MLLRAGTVPLVSTTARCLQPTAAVGAQQCKKYDAEMLELAPAEDAAPCFMNGGVTRSANSVTAAQLIKAQSGMPDPRRARF